MMEVSNYIDAANPDSVVILNSWYARIDLCKKRRMHELDLGFSVEQTQGHVNYDKLTWVLSIIV